MSHDNRSLMGTIEHNLRFQRSLYRYVEAELWEAVELQSGQILWVLAFDPWLSEQPQRYAALCHELDYLSSLQHPYLFSILDRWETSRRQYMMTMYPLSEGRGLRQHADKLMPRELLDLFSGLAALLDWFGQGEWVLDLRPDQIFWRSQPFEFRYLLLPKNNTATLGTQAGWAKTDPLYLSPEEAAGQPQTRSSGYFALGSLLFEMLVGQPAFAASSVGETLELIRYGVPPLLDQAPLRQEARELLSQLWQEDPHYRLQDVSTIQRYLEQIFVQPHPYGSGSQPAIRAKTAIGGRISSVLDDPFAGQGVPSSPRLPTPSRAPFLDDDELPVLDAPVYEQNRSIPPTYPGFAPETPAISSEDVARWEQEKSQPSSGSFWSSPPPLDPIVPSAPSDDLASWQTPSSPKKSKTAGSPAAPMPPNGPGFGALPGAPPAGESAPSMSPPAMGAPRPMSSGSGMAPAAPAAPAKPKPAGASSPSAPTPMFPFEPPASSSEAPTNMASYGSSASSVELASTDLSKDLFHPQPGSRPASPGVFNESTKAAHLEATAPRPALSASPRGGGGTHGAAAPGGMADWSEEMTQASASYLPPPQAAFPAPARRSALSLGGFGGTGAAKTAKEMPIFDEDLDRFSPISPAVASLREEEKQQHLQNHQPAETTIKVLRRKGVVRHYTQMNPGLIFPLLVSLVEAELYIKIPDLPKVQQTESDNVLEIKETSPLVRLVPVLPGCIVSPPEVVVDVRQPKVDAVFWVAPISEGDLTRSARVEIWHDGVCKDNLPLPCVIRTQFLTKLVSGFSVVSAVGGAFLEAFVGKGSAIASASGTTATESWAASLAREAVKLLSTSGLWLGMFFLITALLCYLWLRPKRGDVLEKFLTSEIH